jgi:hypothetical protein
MRKKCPRRVVMALVLLVVAWPLGCYASGFRLDTSELEFHVSAVAEDSSLGYTVAYVLPGIKGPDLVASLYTCGAVKGLRFYPAFALVQKAENRTFTAYAESTLGLDIEPTTLFGMRLALDLK